jgi:hypothetical protein
METKRDPLHNVIQEESFFNPAPGSIEKRCFLTWPAQGWNDIILNFILWTICFAVFFTSATPLRSADFTMTSPDGNVQIKVLLLEQARLGYEVTFKGEAVIKKSHLGITVDNIDLGRGVKIGQADRYEIIVSCRAKQPLSSFRKAARFGITIFTCTTKGYTKRKISLTQKQVIGPRRR